MSTPAPPTLPKPARKRGKPSSCKYFSSLSKRFFKSQSFPSSIEPQSPPSKLVQARSTPRLCCLKRKSNRYFATQARNLSTSPGPEISQANQADPDLDMQMEMVLQDDMNTQGSTPTISDHAQVLELGPSNTSIICPVEDTAATTNATTNSPEIDLVILGESHTEPLTTTMTTVMMKRPLQPPKSRPAVQEEVKYAQEIFDLSDEPEDDRSRVKKVKIGMDEYGVQPSTEPAKARVGFSTTAIDLEEAQNGRADEQQGLAQVAKGGSSSSTSGSSMPNDYSRVENTPKTPGKKKKLFSTPSLCDVASRTQYYETASNEKGRPAMGIPGLGPETPGVSRPQIGTSASDSANRSQQPVNGEEQETCGNYTDSMFLDEGYGSFSAHGTHDDGRVPDNEDELMKSINSSLGPSSPFAQKDRAKPNKLVTPVRAYAEKLQDRDAQRSRRMREAALAAKEQGSKAKATADGSGGLSVGFLEDVESKSQIDCDTAQRNELSTGLARIEQQKEHCRTMNEYTSSQPQGQAKKVPAQNGNAANANMAHASLLDIAKNYVRDGVPCGSVKATQRSSASATPLQKLVADSKVVGPTDVDVSHTGFIQLLEQQQSNGGPGARQKAGASDLKSRQSVISQLTPKRKKSQGLGMSQPTLTAGSQGSYGERLAAEARLLELRNAQVSSTISPVPKASLPKSSHEGSLLDQLVKKKEKDTSSLAESSISGHESYAAETKNTPKKVHRDKSKRSKATVEKAEAALLRMGLTTSLFKDWRDARKCFWASREQEFAGRREDLKEAIAKVIKRQNTQEAKLRTASPTDRKSQKLTNSNVAAAEVVLQDLGLDQLVIDGLSNKMKPKWAKLETQLAETRKRLGDFDTKRDAQEWITSTHNPLTETPANEYDLKHGNAGNVNEGSESEESEEDDGWQYAIKWQGIEQPKNLADSVSLPPVTDTAELVLEESGSEQENNQVKEPSTVAQSDLRLSGVEVQPVVQQHYQNRQAPDADLLRQMQRKRFDDWSDKDGEDDEIHEYVVKAETWGMTNALAEHVFILGRYLDKDKAEETVRDFILSCKPDEVARELEIQSVWTNGNFSQKMIRDGEAGCRAFVELEVTSARRYPDLTEKVARRKSYAVLFERTISTNRSGGDDPVEEDIAATTIDDMAVFTTKSLANWRAKGKFHDWYKKYLDKPQDQCWLRMHNEDLCKHVQELNKEGQLFSMEDEIRKGDTKEKMRVWVKEIAPKGPRN